HGLALLDPLTNLRDAFVVVPWIKELPGNNEECVTWINPLVAPGTLDFAQTVLTSAEVVSGEKTYDRSVGVCGVTGQTVVKAIRLNIPDTQVFGGTYSPSGQVHFADSLGDVGQPRSGLTRATTTRTFEVALIDTAVRLDGSLETGGTDDFGIIVEVKGTEPGAPVVTGEYVFLSFSGGLQGADIDSLDVPPGGLLGTITLLDLDNLHDFLGIKSIESVYIVNANSGEPDFIEAFSLNPVPSTVRFDNNIDGFVTLADVPGFDACMNGPQVPVLTVCSINDADGDSDVDTSDFAVLQRTIAGVP
ncbi:MAG: hypothetical protein ACE5GE_03960, partial [Phycisphaerae bacterium]